MARGLWAAFSIVVGVVAFAVVASSEAVLTRLLALLAGIAPGGLQLGAYGVLALAAAVFALVIFLFLILVPELTDIARLDGVLRGLRAIRPIHEASPAKLLRALAGAPLLAGTAAALRPSLRIADHPELSEKILVSDVAHDAVLVAPVAAPPRARFLRAVLAMLVLCGAALALLNTALPQTLIAHADGATAAAIGTVALACLPLCVAIVLWAGHEILRDITRLQSRLVQDELRALIAPARAAVAAGPAVDGAALRAAIGADMEKLQHALTRFMEAALRRLEAPPPPARIDISAQLGELPQIAGALGALREELTATVQVARDATKLLFSSAQHIEDIANLMREGGVRPPAASEPGLAPAAAPSVAPTANPDDQTSDLRRAIGELLAETSAQSARLPKF